MRSCYTVVWKSVAVKSGTTLWEEADVRWTQGRLGLGSAQSHPIQDWQWRRGRLCWSASQRLQLRHAAGCSRLQPFQAGVVGVNIFQCYRER